MAPVNWSCLKRVAVRLLIWIHVVLGSVPTDHATVSKVSLRCQTTLVARDSTSSTIRCQEPLISFCHDYGHGHHGACRAHDAYGVCSPVHQI
ncbi:hypothetical protein L210DRAFT_3574546 [Boletus edulis BED1]|uniref:Secreted protein n=1 Tax=Boletus edulis BED1 TaxID=1328754 RepID=A0AAD4BDA3_BOLED|nr:hypothetical protein L210DRAFT_3574546 [Boletus edulis BED1]